VGGKDLHFGGVQTVVADLLDVGLELGIRGKWRVVHIGGRRASTCTTSSIVGSVSSVRSSRFSTAPRADATTNTPTTSTAGVGTAVEPRKVLVRQVEEFRPRRAHKAQIRLQAGHHQSGVLGRHGVVQHGVTCERSEWCEYSSIRISIQYYVTLTALTTATVEQLRRCVGKYRTKYNKKLPTTHTATHTHRRCRWRPCWRPGSGRAVVR